jgi:hypothetical protein
MSRPRGSKNLKHKSDGVTNCEEVKSLPSKEVALEQVKEDLPIETQKPVDAKQ